MIARGGDDQLLSTLNTLQTTLANQTHHGGFGMAEAMMFGMMMMQRSVFVVPRPFW